MGKMKGGGGLVKTQGGWEMDEHKPWGTIKGKQEVNRKKRRFWTGNNKRET